MRPEFRIRRMAAMRRLFSALPRWSPASLFAASETGAWYDPSDLSTLWKDTAGTDPVTADGDAVARIDDKSGNGNNATQTTAANRPLYKTSDGLHWLQFDGVDDHLAAGEVLASTLSTLAACIRLRSGTDYRGAWAIRQQIVYASMTGAGTWGGYNGAQVASSYGVGSNTVVVERTRAANDVDLFTNGNTVETVTTGSSFNTRTSAIGSAGTTTHPAALDFYGGVCRLAVLSDADVTSLKNWLAAKGGVTL